MPLNGPLVLGVGQVSQSISNIDLIAVMKSLGRNSGNMMFTEALHQVLKNSKLSSFNPPISMLEDADSIVISAANWINEFDDFSWLAWVLEQTSLPVFLVGIGAQSPNISQIPKVKEGTLRMLKIAAERSTSISARGEFTCDVLNNYGIKNVVPTGCPSLLLARSSVNHVSFDNNRDNSIVLHATRHGFNKCDSIQRYLYKQALMHETDILLQSEDSDIILAFQDEILDADYCAALSASKYAYDTVSDSLLISYLKTHAKFFTNFESWMAYIKTKGFCVGTRIHGTIAALIGGTPAMLITHDSRTLEMARSMSIPYLESSSLDLSADIRFDDLKSGCDLLYFRDNYSGYFLRFMKYFEDNGLVVSSRFNSPGIVIS